MRLPLFLAVSLAASPLAAIGQVPNLGGLWATPNGAGVYRIVDGDTRAIIFAVDDAIYGTGIYGHSLGWLDRTGAGRVFNGELYLSGCSFHLSLEESEDGTVLSGTSRILDKRSSRQCVSVLNKEARNEIKKNGEGPPSRFTLIRR